MWLRMPIASETSEQQDAAPRRARRAHRRPRTPPAATLRRRHPTLGKTPCEPSRRQLAHRRTQDAAPDEEQHQGEDRREREPRQAVGQAVVQRHAAHEQRKIRRHRADRDRRRHERRAHERQRDDGVARREGHASRAQRPGGITRGRTRRRASSCRAAAPTPLPGARPRPRASSSVDLHTVERDAALRDRAARLAEARDEARVDERLHDGRPGGQLARAAAPRSALASVAASSAVRSPCPNSASDAAIAAAAASGPCTRVVTSSASALLRRRGGTARRRRAATNCLDLGAREEREDLEAIDHIGVVGVEPELVHRVGAASAPGRARSRCPRSCRTCVPSLLVISGVPIAWTRLPSARWMRSTPLVRLPHWSLPPVCSTQPYWRKSSQVVQSLQDLVAELGVADALVGVEARADGILLEHRADAVVLADVAQEVDRAQRRGPVEVVDDAGGVVALEAQEALDLRAQVADPLGDGLLRVQRALGGRPRVADRDRSSRRRDRAAGGRRAGGGASGAAARGCPGAGSARSGRSRSST